LLRYKNKTYGARRPPKILVLGPPCSRKYEIAEIIAKKFNIIHISLSELLNKELRRNNENSQIILNCLNTGDLVPDKYVFKLLEDRLYASDCMINGWILTGFPKTASQLHYLDLVNPTFKPSLIVIIQHEYKTVEDRSSQRRIDPLTGKVYDMSSPNFQKLTPNMKDRLQVKTEDKKEVFKKR
jgi:adenylate kinase